MFFKHDITKPQPAWKRPVYIALATVLGLLLSYLAHALIESSYLSYAEKNSLTVTWSMHFGLGSCALPPILQYGLFAAGLFGGFFLGRFWWRIVYVTGKWAKKST